MYKVGIYCRISSQGQNKELSLPAQLHECRVFAVSQGWEVVKEYEEIRSGTSDKRPQFQQMLADAQNELFDVILVHDFSRFARSREIHVLYEAKFAEYGVSLISKSEPIDNSPSGRLNKNILGDINAYYSEQLSFHVKKSQLQLLRQGLWPGNLPLGYRKEGQECVFNEIAPLIKKAFEEFATEKYSLDQWKNVAFRDLGLKSKGGKPFGVGRWSVIFKNEFYIGMMDWLGKRFEGRHEKLIDLATFEKVNQILALRGPRKVNRRFYPLTSLLYSLDAKSRMVGYSANSSSGTYFYYKSMSKATNGREHYAAAEKVEHFFEQFLCDIHVKSVDDLPLNTDPEILLGLKVAPSVGHLYTHLKEYQRAELCKLVVNGRGVNVKADKVVSINLNAHFVYSNGMKLPKQESNIITFS